MRAHRAALTWPMAFNVRSRCTSLCVATLSLACLLGLCLPQVTVPLVLPAAAARPWLDVRQHQEEVPSRENSSADIGLSG